MQNKKHSLNLRARRPEHPRRVVAVVATAVGLLLGGGSLSASMATAATPVEYVALGDSYASGLGLTPYGSGLAAGCGQSQKDYPHQVAAAYGWKLTDVSCAGAVIRNITDTAQATPVGVAAPQISALSASTDVVTISIGGNDIGFSSVLGSCFAASPVGPLLTNPSAKDCKTGSPAAAALPGVLANQAAPALNSMLAAVKKKAPNAHVYLVGYPTIFPALDAVAAGSCFVPVVGSDGRPIANAYPFTGTDVAFFHGLQASLEQSQRALAQQNGVGFISMQATFSGQPLGVDRTPCGASPASLVNGVTLASLQPPSVTQGTLHPGAAGVDFMTDMVKAWFARAKLTSPTV